MSNGDITIVGYGFATLMVIAVLDWFVKAVYFEYRRTVAEYEAIAFAEWKRDNDVVPQDNEWYFFPDRQKLYSTKELYQIFKQQQ